MPAPTRAARCTRRRSSCASSFATIGVDLVLEPKDYAVWMQSAHLKWDFDLSMGSYQTGPDPAVAVARLYITKNIEKLMGRNLMGYSNPKVDELFDAGEREIDPEEARPDLS